MKPLYMQYTVDVREINAQVLKYDVVNLAKQYNNTNLNLFQPLQIPLRF